jgi:hypothetical protein
MDCVDDKFNGCKEIIYLVEKTTVQYKQNQVFEYLKIMGYNKKIFKDLTINNNIKTKNHNLVVEIR